MLGRTTAGTDRASRQPRRQCAEDGTGKDIDEVVPPEVHGGEGGQQCLGPEGCPEDHREADEVRHEGGGDDHGYVQ